LGRNFACLKYFFPPWWFSPRACALYSNRNSCGTEVVSNPKRQQKEKTMKAMTVRNFLARNFALCVLLSLSVTSAPAQVVRPVPPVPNYDEVLLFMIDARLDFPVTGLTSLTFPDPQLNSLKTVMGFDEAAVRKFRADGEAFFRDSFGIDFTNLPVAADGSKTIPGVARLDTAVARPEINYYAVYSNQWGGNLPGSPLVTDIALIVTITGNDVRYHGTYGGAAGSPAYVGETLAYGYYHLQALPMRRYPYTRTLNMRFESNGPMRSTPTGMGVVDCAVYHPELGKGLAYGAAIMTPNSDGTLQLTARNVLAFPGPGHSPNR
jgi:hypothetical protein